MKVYIMMVSYFGREDSIVEVFADYDACCTAIDFANSDRDKSEFTDNFMREFEVTQ